MAWIRIVLVGLFWLAAMAPGLRAAPVEITTGGYISSISGIDPADGSYRIAAYLWFIGLPGAFDPAQEVEVLARSASISKVGTRDLPDGRLYTALLVDATVDQSYDLSRFPFDRQVLQFRVDSQRNSSEIVLVPDSASSRIASFVNLPAWRLTGLTLGSGASAYDSNFGFRDPNQTYSRITFSIEIERTRSMLLFEKFTGFLVAFLLTVFGFGVPAKELGIRVGIMTGAIYAAVLNRYRLEDKIGFDTSFGLSDQLSILIFSAILCGLLVSLHTHKLTKTRSEAEVAPIDRRLGARVMAFHFLLILLVVGLALR